MKRLLSGLMLCTALCLLMLAFTSCFDFLGGADNDEAAEHKCNYEKETAEEQYLKSLATCTKSAVYYKSCECGKKGAATFEYGEPNEHVFYREINTGTYLKENASCQSPAVYYKSCACGERGEDTDTFEDGGLGGHAYEDEICTVCGAKYGTAALKYSLSADEESYIVTGTEDTNLELIQIPKFYENKPVIAIGEGAFSGLGSLRRVEIPESVRTMGKDAFSGCAALEELVYAGTVEEGEALFNPQNNWNGETGAYVIKCSDGKINKPDVPIHFPIIPI